MIEFRRDGAKMVVRLDPDRGTLKPWFFKLEWGAGGDAYAALLVEEMQRQLGDLVEELRREEYEAGYKDGRAKRAKRDWFWRVLKRKQ